MKQLYPHSFSKVALPTKTFLTGILVLFSGLFAQAQTTPVSGITTFNTISSGDYIEYAQTSDGSAGFGATNVQSSGWDVRAYTSGPDDYVIAGENWGAGSSNGGFIYVALYGGATRITSMRFTANDGKLFDLNSLDLGYDVFPTNTAFTITGYRSGVAVPGAYFPVTPFASFGNGGNWSTGINIAASNSNFKGIDEFRITPNTPGVLIALDVDNINAINFRAVNYAQIIPSDIPSDNEGAFTKVIAGHSFTFTPPTDNYVSYNNDVGTEGYGGLYAYDYNTYDGTEVTISAPAGYTFDLSSFQYISDRGPVSLAVTVTFLNNSTDNKIYTLNGNSNVQTFNGFTTAANDVKSIQLVSDALLYLNNFEVSDIKALTTLPLQWLKFSAAAQGQQVVLNWRTAGELGTKDFLVQHSRDGRQWQNIGTVLANGVGNTEQNYSFTHNTPANGVNVYRLLQRDIDGRSSYSPIVTINVTGLHEQFSVYPNPAVNGTVQVKLQESAVIYIYNSSGALVAQKQLPVGVSSLNLNGFAKGFYTLKMKSSSILLRVP